MRRTGAEAFTMPPVCPHLLSLVHVAIQAKPPADTFIGYGGVAVREKVQAGADWFVKDFTDLINIVK